MSFGIQSVNRSQDRFKGRFTSGNSYNRISAPADLGPKQLPDEKALAVGGGWGSTWYLVSLFCEGGVIVLQASVAWDQNTA
jgi:hypothetical protein